MTSDLKLRFILFILAVMSIALVCMYLYCKYHRVPGAAAGSVSHARRALVFIRLAAGHVWPGLRSGPGQAERGHYGCDCGGRWTGHVDVTTALNQTRCVTSWRDRAGLTLPIAYSP